MIDIKKSNQTVNFIISSALILFYLADGINKYFQLRQSFAHEGDFSDSFSASIYLRFFYELIFLFLIYRFYDRERGKGIVILFALFVSFLLGQLIFLLGYHDLDYSPVYHITVFNKYIFLFLIYYGIKDILNDQRVLMHVANILQAIFVINSLLIFVGVIFQITLFKSYFAIDWRYGYDGLLGSINEATLFYLIGISFLYFKYINTKKGVWSLWICIFASLLMGAKAMYLFIFLLLTYHILVKANIIQKVVTVGVLVLSGIAAIPILFSDKFSFLYEAFIYTYDKEGLLYTITSGRSGFVMTKFIANLDLWGPLNYLFGGTDQLKYYIEMDFLDGFLFLGVVGFILLMALYFNTFFKGISFKSFRLFFCISYFLIAFLAGHFFASAVNALYFNIALFYIYAVENRLISSDINV